jgi:putative FmdB family regulatory protein
MSPMYDYQCGECGEVWTRIHQFDSAPPPCPECGNGGAKRLPSTCAFKFVGAGFHSTDYHKDRPKDFNEFVNGKQDTDENA